MTLVNDAMSASMPGTAKQFLSTVQPKPIGQMVMYVAIIALLPLVGYLLGGLIAGWGVQWGIIWGIIMYIGTIAAVIGGGMVVGVMSNGILGRQISNEEAVTLVGYAATPAIAIGFISGLLAFNWGLGVLGTVLGFLGWLYMGYLIYLGGGAKYGPDKAMIAAVIALVAGFVITWIFSTIAWQLLWQQIWGGYYNQYANYYNNLARYYTYP